MISVAGQIIHWQTVHQLNVTLIKKGAVLLEMELLVVDGADLNQNIVHVRVVLITEKSVTQSVKTRKYVTKQMELADVNPDLRETTVKV